MPLSVFNVRTAPGFRQTRRVLDDIRLRKGANSVADVLFQLLGFGAVKVDAREACHKDINALSLDGVGNGHNGCLDDIRVVSHGPLELGGTNTVPRHLRKTRDESELQLSAETKAIALHQKFEKS